MPAPCKSTQPYLLDQRGRMKPYPDLRSFAAVLVSLMTNELAQTLLHDLLPHDTANAVAPTVLLLLAVARRRANRQR